MTKAELAQLIDGREYRSEITIEEQHAAIKSGLVVVCGASDDIICFYGAIYDEAYGPGEVVIDRKGIRPRWDDIDPDDEEDAKHYFDRKSITPFVTIKALWCESGEASWTYQTDAEHETFRVMEDGELYCVGIVIDMPKGNGCQDT